MSLGLVQMKQVKRFLAVFFRSLCPLTGQPDWATIRVAYSGKLINYQKLFSYLLSFRNSQAFNEECVEKIFSDLKKFCAPNELTVRANFFKKGWYRIKSSQIHVRNI